jgi:small subunit ribosomal protein S13
MSEQELNPLVRIVNVDIKGSKALYYGLTKIKGVSFSYANAVCHLCGVDQHKKIGYLTKEDIGKVEDVLLNPSKHNIPNWMLNRRRDMETGEDKHILSGDIKFTVENDIRRLQKIKSRRGMRHAWKLPVRGQRTKGNFRKATAVGVKRKSGAKSGRV